MIAKEVDPDETLDLIAYWLGARLSVMELIKSAQFHGPSHIHILFQAKRRLALIERELYRAGVLKLRDE